MSNERKNHFIGRSRDLKSGFSLFLGVFLTTLFFVEVRAAQVYRLPAEVVGDKAWEFDWQASYFQSTGHYDDHGKKVPLAGQESFSKLDNDLSVRYGLGRKFELSTGLRGRQNWASTDDPELGQNDLKAQGIESYFLGSKYTLQYDPRWNLGFEILYRQSTFHNEDYSAERRNQILELGDEMQEFGGGFHLSQKSLINPILSASLMYFQRSNDLSSEVRYRAEGIYQYKTWAFACGLEGIYSLKTDPYTDDPQNKPPLHTHPTYLFNSINRSYVAPLVQVNKSLGNNLFMKMGIKTIVTGVSTDRGNEVFLGLTWKLPGKTREQSKLDSFKEYEVEASVVRLSPRRIFLKIDKGLTDDIQKGMNLDIFQFDYMGGNVLVASGVVYEVSAESALVKVFKKYRNIEIKVGFVVRGKISENNERGLDQDL